MLRSSAVGDSRPAVTRDELLWLGKVAEHLPKQVSRVRPGALEEVEAVPSIDDEAATQEWCIPLSVTASRDASDMEAACGLNRCRPVRSMSASAMGRMAANAWSPSPASTDFTPSSTNFTSTFDCRISETVHERLYREGFECQQRARDLEAARALKPARVAILDANPEVFNRLHKDFERMQERKRDRVEQYEESMCPQQDWRRCREQDGVLCHDKEAFERLVRAREPETKPV